ncbi:c-type cytochrome [Robiginitalea sediminis]|uniref:c-type cytochrome n=1 Tax=Robiginitalea sediminis TaxID=1982593 RepID=UPI000B4B04EC|nr:c-type cytochrome [Robiginitalea sediminis]
MKSKSLLWGLAILLSLGIIACQQGPKPEVVTQVAELTTQDPIQRGKYLVEAIGCADCHSPKKMTEQGPVLDMDRYMMGYDASMPLPPVPQEVPLGPWILMTGDLTAAVGPWGVSYAANLTPHASGLGNWSIEQFKKALREGKYKGLDNSRPLMPPMPVQAFRNLTDQDLEAMFAYLQSLRPIDNVVPAYQPPGS